MTTLLPPLLQHQPAKEKGGGEGDRRERGGEEWSGVERLWEGHGKVKRRETEGEGGLSTSLDGPHPTYPSG